MPSTKTILIIDDDQQIREISAEYLRHNGFNVSTAADGIEALQLCVTQNFDCILLDLMMPNMDGATFMATFRTIKNTPIIISSARISEDDKVHFLEIGADDYLVKPTNLRELVARINAVIRRTTQTNDVSYISERLRINPANRSVIIHGNTIALTHTEYLILATLIAQKGQTVSRYDLVNAVFEDTSLFGNYRTVDVHIYNLRKKIEHDVNNPEFIFTVYGVGYMCKA
jgi:DNA-binding response OmpR family regulator